MKDGYIKVAAVSHPIQVGDAKANAHAIVAEVRRLAALGCRVVVTPELGLTGYTVGELLLQETLLADALSGLQEVLTATADLDVVCVVGLPIVWQDKLYNCAAVCHSGRLLGIVAKFNLPNYNEFYEARYFVPSPADVQTITLFGRSVPFGGLQVFAADNMPNLRLGVEICEDLWTPSAPHNTLAEAGATVLCNLSASDNLVGKAEFCTQLVRATSATCVAAYIYCDTINESTTDLVFAGHDIVACNGRVLAEAAPFGAHEAVAVVDVDCLQYDRRRITSFATRQDVVKTTFAFAALGRTDVPTPGRFPFVPQDAIKMQSTAKDILAIQANGLARRMTHIGAKHMVLGVSGGLDSTLALLVCHEACRLMGRPAADVVIGVTMPCFGTTSRTKNNALALCEALGVPCRTVNIAASVRQHLDDIGHNHTADVAFENAQARMRTMVLMDIANACGGIVVGTGDLSELALGWCTYNGDHMSMYSVNASVPKTLVSHIVRQVADRADPALQAVLLDVLDTPISPELLPAVDGQIAQKTEDIIGKYDINDFILYHMIRWGMPPHKIYRLILAAFGPVPADGETEAQWQARKMQHKANLRDVLVRFYRRFFSQQFKRNCVPDGPKVGTVALSPRGDWRMPSDASAAAWIRDAESIDLTVD